ncbi:hypothetical protein GWK47_040426 [Chionoecetes opilio]|uniref:Uncharacterized protein n=1 Tax=Chionoecetes opilio TaxID=41210 RepID=A0A8J4YAQ9_CHIOP|nr:hypothetical protein GWK47_040426 [Chionoecetes opilio]
MVGMLARADADLAIANLFVTSLEGRDEYQGYTNFFDADYSCFLIRTEPPLPRWQSPGLPFTLPTWVAIVSGLLVIAVILNLVASAAVESTRFPKVAPSGCFRYEPNALELSLGWLEGKSLKSKPV